MSKAKTSTMFEIKTEDDCDAAIERLRGLINDYIERKLQFNYKLSARVTFDIELIEHDTNS